MNAYTAQAFSKARNKLNPSALVALNDVLQRQLEQQRLRRRWQGSMVHLPLESHQAQHFGSHSGLPVARLSTLYDLCDNQTLHGLLVPTDVDERGCTALHLDHAPDNSLIVFDRGYPAHWLFGDLRRRNQHFLMRLSTGYNQQVNDFVASGGPEATHQFSCSNWLSRKVCEQSGVDPDTVVAMRLIRVTLTSGEVEVLATSLPDTDYRRLKQTLKLENFSGRSVIAHYSRESTTSPCLAVVTPGTLSADIACWWGWFCLS